jgi:adenine-specific DNA-methyltransferase
MNRLFIGDNKILMASLLSGGFKAKITLIYIDPPFCTGSDLHYARDSANAGNGQKAYVDKWGTSLDAYLRMMQERLVLMNDLLSEDGGIYVHLDDHVSHYVKIMMDGIFGRENLVNQIIWQRTGAHNDPEAYGRNYDVILFYQKSDIRVWNKPMAEYDEAHLARYFKTDTAGRWYRLNNPTGKGYQDHTRNFGKGPVKPPRDRHWSISQEQVEVWIKEQRIAFTASGYPLVKKYLDELPGKQVQSIWTDLIPPRSSRELTGFPTQKPEKLLDRIIRASSNPGDLVADFFCGSGTTLVTAEKLGRGWIGCDANPETIAIARSRLTKIPNCKPFEVVEVKQ